MGERRRGESEMGGELGLANGGQEERGRGWSGRLICPPPTSLSGLGQAAASNGSLPARPSGEGAGERALGRASPPYRPLG